MSAEADSFTGVVGLNPQEVRVLGCLLEKQRTTPEMYPLTLNSLRLACNQATSRDPVADYDEGIIREALHRLERRGYVRLASGQGSRAPKYRHLLADALPMGPDEQAFMCVLMLRGSQTPGELKQRAGRMHTFASMDLVHETLDRLIARRLVARLGRRPGQKEERYSQLLGEPARAEELGPAWPAGQSALADQRADAQTTQAADHDAAARDDVGGLLEQLPGTAPSPDSIPEWGVALAERISSLEREVAELRAALHRASVGNDVEGVRL